MVKTGAMMKTEGCPQPIWTLAAVKEKVNQNVKDILREGGGKVLSHLLI